MAVTAVTYYSVAMTYNGSTVWSRGPQRSSGTFAADGVHSLCDNRSSPNYANLYYIAISFYPYKLYLSTGIVVFGQSGPSTITAGTQFGSLSTVSGAGGSITGYQVNTYYGAATGSSYSANEGQRVVTLACTAGGRVTSPGLVGPSAPGVAATVVPTAWTRPTGDVSAATGFATITAGDGQANSGTLLARGYGAATWVNWTWSDAFMYSAQQDDLGVAVTKSITINLRAGTTDGTITANFLLPENSASIWSPKLGNVVIHLSDKALVETDLSSNAVGSDTAWSAFRDKTFTALSCSLGALQKNWYPTASGYTSGVYLMNVASANFAVTPLSGLRVYAWKLEKAGVFTEFGSANGATISGFDEGCKVHLYLTSATPNPCIVYDGFVATGGGIVPADQSVVEGGSRYPVGKSWPSTSEAGAISVSLSPRAWAAKTLGQVRSVIVDTVSTTLANVAGTGASVTSAATPYAVNHVTFKQVAVATDGVLTVTVVLDTITDVLGVSINVSQASTLLKTIKGAGTATAGYYVGTDKVSVTATVNYGSASPANFILRMEPDAVYDDDTIGTTTATLQVAGTTRAITFYARQAVVLGSLTAVDVNLTRDVTVGTQIATSAGPVTQSYAGGVAVTMQLPTGQSTALPIYVECSAVTGYTLKSIRVVDSATGAKNYYTGNAPAVSTAIRLNIPRLDTGADIKVILVMSAVIVGMPSMLPMLPDDLGKFAATITPATGHDDFRVGDKVTLDAAPVIDTNPMTGIAIGSPTFNDVEIAPTRTGTSIAAIVTLSATGNVFKIPVYATFAASASPAGATVTTTWDVDDTLTVSDVVYRRIGSTFTATAPLTYSGNTVVAGRVSRRAVTSPFDYIESAVLLPYVASLTTRSFTNTLRGPSQCVAIYSAGNQYPTFSFATCSSRRMRAC